MDSETHLVVGGFLAALDNILDSIRNNREINLLELVSSALVGAGAGVLPDLIEPATSPNHRGFFHSIAISGAPLNYLRTTSVDTVQVDPQRWIKRAITIGYLSHLGLDGTTPKGLPLLM